MPTQLLRTQFLRVSVSASTLSFFAQLTVYIRSACLLPFSFLSRTSTLRCLCAQLSYRPKKNENNNNKTSFLFIVFFSSAPSSSLSLSCHHLRRRLLLHLSFICWLICEQRR